MAGGREIKTKIKSVQNTRKVTRALEMVSASKIRKAQDKMKASRPYARLMKQVVGHIAHANTDYVHPFMAAREDVKRVGYIIVSTDRGLCGGLNSQLFRRILADIREWQGKGVEVDVVCIGQKASTFFRRLKVDMLGSVTHLGEQPELAQLIGVTKTMLDRYIDGRLDRVVLCFNDFVNTNGGRARTALNNEALDIVGKDIELLDAYVYLKGEIGDIPQPAKLLPPPRTSRSGCSTNSWTTFATATTSTPATITSPKAVTEPAQAAEDHLRPPAFSIIPNYEGIFY